jgi:hypothetical protein
VTADRALPEVDWLESIGSFLALRPPNRWKDEDEDNFLRELENLGGRFKRAESIGFALARGKKGLRVAVTSVDGSERHEVIHFDESEEKILGELEGQMTAWLSQNKRLAIAAATRAIWPHLNIESETPK